MIADNVTSLGKGPFRGNESKNYLFNLIRPGKSIFPITIIYCQVTAKLRRCMTLHRLGVAVDICIYTAYLLPDNVGLLITLLELLT